MAYQPIENYGLIGNMRTVALVGLNGSIDWFCFPHFDSPSVFASILDHVKGGYFKISPLEEFTSKQFYWPDTNVLVTGFYSKYGVCELIDYMPVGDTRIGEGKNRLVRRVKQVRGAMAVKVDCYPVFNYARDKHEVILNEQGAAFHRPNLWSLSVPTSIIS